MPKFHWLMAIMVPSVVAAAAVAAGEVVHCNAGTHATALYSSELLWLQFPHSCGGAS